MNKRYFVLSVLSLLFIIGFSSCEKEINDENLKNIKWILTDLEVLSGKKEPTKDMKEVFIEFQDSIIQGNDGCNGYWITYYKLEDNIFEVKSIAVTEIYCGEEINDFEELYLSILKSSKRIKIKSNRLTIISDIGELHYRE